MLFNYPACTSYQDHHSKDEIFTLKALMAFFFPTQATVDGKAKINV